MWWYHFLLYPVLFFLGKKAKSIIHLSTPLKKNADNFLGKKNKQKNIVIPNGISKNEIINTPKPTNTIIKALFVGRLVDQKDPLSAIKAMSILAKKNIQISLTIIGDGELKKEIENYVSANNLSSVILLGKLDRETVLKKMSEADLLIAPSREEAMSIAILEAIAQKLFVITTPAADLEKLIATYNCGAYVPLSNPTAIADAIQSFRENIFNKKPVISNENYQNFIDNYCWENIAAQYIATLSKN